MTFDEYQKTANKTAIYPGRNGSAGLVYTVLGLTGEAGEVSDKLKKVKRDNASGEPTLYDRRAMLDELGDVLWYVTQSAQELGYCLEDVAAVNNHKLQSRLERGTIGGSGDVR